jgi:SAM-dependent methyltransferase
VAKGLEHYVIKGGGFGRERLRILSRVLAPGTRALLTRAGLREGLACLDLGCGGADVAREMAAAVGPAGRVVGVELDAAKVALARAELASVPNLSLEVGDARALAARAEFDLVYTRFLLTYLAARADVLSRIRAALVPGGTLVVEDIDFSGHFDDPHSPAFRRYVSLFSEVVRRRGGDPDVGPRLPRLLLEAGFEGVEVSVTQPVFLEGEGKEIAAITFEGIADSVVAEGLATAEELHETLAGLNRFIERADTLLSLPRVVQVIGRTTRR